MAKGREEEMGSNVESKSMRPRMNESNGERLNEMKQRVDQFEMETHNYD